LSLDVAPQCTLSQTPSGTFSAYLSIAPVDTGVTESGTATATTSCGAIDAPRLTASVAIADLGAVQHHTSGSRVGKGPGPVTAQAAQNVSSTQEPGPTVRFTFVSTLTTSSGATARICQQATVDLAGNVSQYSENC
jgi:hypothetical protein